MKHKIVIDHEFQSLLPPLTAEELKHLELNIINDGGARDPLVTWNGILIAGHNRHAICTKHKLPYTVKEMQFADRAAVMDWMDAEQLGRRSLTPDVRTLILGRIYNRAKKQEGRPAKLDQNDPVIGGSTASRIADDRGVGEATVKRAGKFADAVEAVKAVDPEIERKVSAGEAPAKTVIIEAAKVADAEPAKAKAILSGEKLTPRTEKVEKPKPAPKKPKAGSPVFDDRKFDAVFGALMRFFDHRYQARLDAGIGKKRDAEHTDCIDKMNLVHSAWMRWQKATT